MTPLVLVILVVMWVLVLVPPLLRSRSDGRPNHSISSFQRQLRTLQRTGGYPPSSVTYLRAQGFTRRTRAADPYADDYDDHAAEPRARGYAPTPVARYAPGYPTSNRAGSGPSASRSAYAARNAAAGREAVRKRRQNILFTLLGAAFVTAVVGFGMGVSFMVWGFAFSVVALVLYVALLVQTRRAAEMRAYRSSWSRMAA